MKNECLKKYLKVYKKIILFWTFFIGIGAVIGSLMFFTRPYDGYFMDGLLEVMRAKMPLGDILFTNFIFSGIALLIVNGITNFIASYYIIKNKKVGYFLGTLFGVTLMLWITIQFILFAPTIYPIDVIFFIFGLLQFVSGYLAYSTYRQLEFKFDESEYKNIAKDSKKIVVYFSRMGYTKKIAYQKADDLGAEILEIKTDEHIVGITGFFWCGRFGMHRWGMKIQNNDINFKKYDEVYVFSPVWVFAISSPIREFLKEYGTQLPKVHINLVHFMNCKLLFKKDLKKMGIQYVDIMQYSSHFGKVKKLR